jgi:hypothetical protein
MQYRLRTLLIVIAWIGLMLVALRAPTEFWSAVIEATTFLAVATAALVVIYRTGVTRAMGVGFLIFSTGWLAYNLVVMFTFRSSTWLDLQNPITKWLYALFTHLHPESFDGNYKPSEYNVDVFIAIAIYSLANVVGVVGAIIAQLLYATRKQEPA